jgi:hypothetical protein
VSITISQYFVAFPFALHGLQIQVCDIMVFEMIDSHTRGSGLDLFFAQYS